MNVNRYTLEPYNGMNTRYFCPNCEKKVFVRYVDTETGKHISPSVGRCNRESNCGYHYTPKQYFQDNNINAPQVLINPKPLPPQQKPPSFIPVEIFKASLKNNEPNNFIKFLIDLFGVEVAKDLISRYFIATSTHWNGATIFWQIDIKGKIRTGKIMLYDASTGKRVKQPYNHITWVHKALKQPEFELRQCFFGEHLIQDKTKPVAIVESEKTAIISSVYFPQLIWLAAGSLEGLNADKCKVLKGRKVILFPDLNGFDKWNGKAKELNSLANFTVFDVLERNATEIQRLQGLDLADYLIKFDYRNFAHPTPKPLVQVRKATPQVSINELAETFRKAKLQSWNVAELENFFKAVKLPSAIQLDKCSKITNVPLFIKSHLDIVKTQNGNTRFLPYLDRLNELKSILKSNSN